MTVSRKQRNTRRETDHRRSSSVEAYELRLRTMTTKPMLTVLVLIIALCFDFTLGMKPLKADLPKIFEINNDDDDDDVLVTPEMQAAYNRDGVIAVRGLIDPELLEQLDEETTFRQEQTPRRKGSSFVSMKHGAVLNPDKVPVVSSDDAYSELESASALFRLALLSKVPRLASELVQNEQLPSDDDDCAETDATTCQNNKFATTVRMLRDVLLVKDSSQSICGWHVDDFSFWPATPESPGGVNAWVALDDMERDGGGGGLALAVGTHLPDWEHRHEAHKAVHASTIVYPAETGFSSAVEMVETGHMLGTCSGIEENAADLWPLLEQRKRVYQLRRGDVIFHTRWLFHRTFPVNNVSDKEDAIFRRYSLRYVPGSTVLPRGYCGDMSSVLNPDNAGKSLDDICAKDGPWYPQVWPSVSLQELADLKNLVQTKVPAAQALQQESWKDMMPYFQKAMAAKKSDGYGATTTTSDEKKE